MTGSLAGKTFIVTGASRGIGLAAAKSIGSQPIVYTDTQRAILAIEKGRPGERAFGEAFAAWEGRDPLRGDRQ